MAHQSRRSQRTADGCVGGQARLRVSPVPRGRAGRVAGKLRHTLPWIALYTVWYNFVQMHKTLEMIPALAAGVSQTLRSMNDLVALVDAFDAAQPRKTGSKAKDYS